MVSNTVDECLQGQIAQKIFKSKIKASPANAGHNMAFKHHISFATDLTANFGCSQFRITPDIVSKLLHAAIWSRILVDVLLDLNLSRRPFLGQVVNFRIQIGTCCLFLCHIFTQRPMTDRKIERSYGRRFCWPQLLANSIENFIHMKAKSDLSLPKIYNLAKH